MEEESGVMDGTQSHKKPGWVASHMEVVVIIVIVVLVVLPLAFILQARVTVVFVSEEEPTYPFYVQVFIDGELQGFAEIDRVRLHVSYAVGVGHHEVVVAQGLHEYYRDIVMTWPFVGAEIHCRL